MAKSKLYLPTLIFNINTFVFYINKLQEGKMLMTYRTAQKMYL